jgi:hypothetical protein
MAYSKALKDALETDDHELLKTISDEELTNVLITLDGLGMDLKKKALEILLQREWQSGYRDS